MSMLINPYSFTQAAYVATANDYDGTNDYQSRATDMGAVDGKTFTFSVWTRIDGGDSANRVLFTNGATLASNGILIRLDTSNKVVFIARNAADTVLMDIQTVATYLAGATWRNILGSFDLADAGKRHLYITDVADMAVSTYTNDTIDFTRGAYAIGAETDGGSMYNGCVSELFFHTAYIDLSIQANRRKFISATGKAVLLGADGSFPLGVQPILYAPTGDASGTGNKGTGGAFTTTGALTACSSSPTD